MSDFLTSKHITTDDFLQPQNDGIMAEMAAAWLGNHPAARLSMQQGICDAGNCLWESL